MKNVFTLPLLALLCGCATQTTVPVQNHAIQTSAPRGHLQNVSRDIQGWHNFQHPDCPYVRVVGAKIVERDSDSTVEHWTIEACKQKQFTYQALILPYPDGGIGVSVSNVDLSPANVSGP